MSKFTRSAVLSCAALATALSVALAPMAAQAGGSKPKPPAPRPAPSQPGPSKTLGFFGSAVGATVKSIGDGLSTLARRN